MSTQYRTSSLPAAKSPGAAIHPGLNPLMHSLLESNLVKRVRTVDGAYRWKLAEAAEHRLDELARSMERPAAALAYLNHRCARCREHGLTHLINDRYLCGDCQWKEDSTAEQAGRAVWPQA